MTRPAEDMDKSADDRELLVAFARDGSQEAFAALARRYAGLLFHTALRRAGGRADLAEEAAQNTLTILARKAAALSASNTPLAPWLHRAVRFEAGRVLRRERRHDDRMKRLFNSTPGAAPDLSNTVKADSLRRFGTSNTRAEDHAEILRLAAGITDPALRVDALTGASASLGETALEKAGEFIAQAGLPPAEARRLSNTAASAPLKEARDIDVAGRLKWRRERPTNFSPLSSVTPRAAGPRRRKRLSSICRD